MTDLAIQTLDDGTFDIAMFNGDFVPDDSLRTAVLISLFSDAEDDAVVDGDRRGWWGDALSDIEGDRIGSKLWKLNRSKLTQDAVNDTQSYIQAALQWLVDDAVARSVSVTAYRADDQEIDADIEIDQPNGVQRFRLSELWAANFVTPFDEDNAIAGSFADSTSLLNTVWQSQLPEGDL